MLERVRELLQENGRSLVQGALGWLMARSPLCLPIPGFRSVAQVEDIAKALEFGPLSPTRMAEIEKVIARPEEGEPRGR